MASGLRVKEMKIKGFRGYGEEEKRLDFSSPVVLIRGGNRSGKSSTLNALEWVLYGDEMVGKTATGISERKKGWLIRNRGCKLARVEVVFESGGGEIRVRREMGGGSSSRKSKAFSFVDEGGREYEDQTELWKRLGMELKDFMSSVYLHQEVIRDIVVSEPKNRKEALERLLGVSDLRRLVESLKKVKVKNFQDRSHQIYDELRRDMEIAIRSYRDQEGDFLEQGKRRGLEESRFTERGYLDRCRLAEGSLSSVAAKAGISDFQIEGPQGLADGPRFEERAKTSLRQLRSENPGAVSQRGRLEERERLRQALSEFEVQAEKLRNLREEKASLESGGDLEALRRRRSEKEAALEDVEARMKDMHARLPVIERTIDYLSGLEDRASRIPCPACEQDILPAEVLERLREVRVNLGEEARKLAEEKNDLSNEIEKLDRDIEKLRALVEEKIPRAERELQAARDEVGRSLGRELTGADDIQKLAGDRMKEIEKELERARQVLEEYNRDLDSVEDSLEDARIIRQVLELRERMERIQSLTRSEVWKSLDEARDRLNRQLDAVAKVREAVESVSREVLDERLKAVEDRVAQYFRMLVDRPDFPEICIRAEDGEVLAVSDSESEKIVDFFNQGDMNCAALSIFLALGGGASDESRSSFIFLDDPSQSLDMEQKRKLARLLDVVAGERQVILATMDEELLDCLREEVGKAKKAYCLGKWDPVSGPSIRES